MKVSVFTRRLSRNPSQKEYLEQIKQAAEIASSHHSRLLVLPGWSLGNHNSAWTGPVYVPKEKGIDALQGISNTYQIAFVADIGGTYFLQPNHSLPTPLEQRFGQSDDKFSDYEKFSQEWNSGKRFVKMDDKIFGLMLCGENNFIANKQNEGNRAILRYPQLGWSDNYDVLLNPSHTIMGNWGKLHARFGLLSTGGKTVIYITNNTRKGNVKTNLCVYRDGQKSFMGDFADCDSDKYVIYPEWRIITFDV